MINLKNQREKKLKEYLSGDTEEMIIYKELNKHFKGFPSADLLLKMCNIFEISYLDYLKAVKDEVERETI